MSLYIEYTNTAHTLQEYPVHVTTVSCPRYNIGDQAACSLIRRSYIIECVHRAQAIIAIHEVTILTLSVRAQCGFWFSSASSPTRSLRSVARAAASGTYSRVSPSIPFLIRNDRAA